MKASCHEFIVGLFESHEFNVDVEMLLGKLLEQRAVCVRSD